MDRLPRFSFADYRIMLDAFHSAGYQFGLIAEKEISHRTVYLRHDVDFFLDGWMSIPESEAAVGARATYYILVGHYDLSSSRALNTMKRLVTLGHEIGLHYDTRRYPADADTARERMTAEIEVLQGITGRNIRTVTRHNVFLKAHEPARVAGLIDPYDPDYLSDMTYISDSVRSWRDYRLLECFGPVPPHQVVLLTHPESWLDGRIENRVDYLSQIVFPRIEGHDQLKDELMQIWTSHEAARLHDEREAGVTSQ
jgi:hypothetical protein